MLGNELFIGEKVRLAPVARQDLPENTRWFNQDIEMLRFVDDSPAYPHIPADDEDWFNDIQTRAGIRSFPFSIWTLDDNRLVGGCGIGDMNWRSRVAEVGIQIGGAENRSRGYGADAMKIMLRFAFLELNLNRIMLHTFGNNERGIRSYEKAGFILEGRYRGYHLRDGQWSDMVVMSVLQKDWVNANSA